MTATGSTANKAAIVSRRLYRSLLRACKPYTEPAANAVTLNCLLHRSGYDDDEPLIIDRSIREGDISSSLSKAEGDRVDSMLGNEGMDSITSNMIQDRARDLRYSYTEKDDAKDISLAAQSPSADDASRTDERLFHSLLREAMTGSTEGESKMLFPIQVDPTRMQSIIRREFRGDASVSSKFDISIRHKVAFHALRELHKKLSLHDALVADQAQRQPRRNALSAHVQPLDRMDPSSYLQPGAFLLSHPYMLGSFFGRTVICILDHDRGETTKLDRAKLPSPAFHTYGLIINRFSMHRGTQRAFTMNEAMPQSLDETIGDLPVREGGPVHTSIQMLHRRSPQQDDEAWSPGGMLLPDLMNAGDAVLSDKALFFQGNINKAAEALAAGHLQEDDIAFFAGASVWSRGQLEDEVRSGYWLPCKAPIDLALSRPGKDGDLWVSLMTGYGAEEAKLASLFDTSDAFRWDNKNGLPCDDFD